MACCKRFLPNRNYIFINYHKKLYSGRMTIQEQFLWKDMGEEPPSIATKGVIKTIPMRERAVSYGVNPKNAFMLNPYFHGIYYAEGIEEVPLMRPDTGPLPDELIGFNEMGKPKNISQRNAVHFYLYDKLILRYYRNPEKYFDTLKKYGCVLGLDLSIFYDLPRGLNVANIITSRYVGCNLQERGLRVIPSYSWGNLDSLDYCSLGIPQHSNVAISNAVIGKHKEDKLITRLAIERLVEEKNPLNLLVYGFPLDFNPRVPVKYYTSKIQKLRKYGKSQH